MRKIYFLILTTFIFNFCLAQKSELALNLEIDKEYKQVTNSTATVIQDINGQKMNMVMTIKGTMSYLVKAVNNKDFDMEVKYENLSMLMQLPQGTMEFSSEKNDENDIFSMLLGEMKNKPFKIKMTKSGKITEVKNIELLFESVFKKFPQLDEAQLGQLKSQLMNAYGEKAFKGNIEMVTAIFPEKSVSKGDDWIIKTKLEAGMSADMTTTYKYIEENSEHILIHGDSKLETADKDAYIESNGMPLKYDLTGVMTSVIKVDKETGWIIEAKIHQKIEGDTYIKENPQMPNGMKIPMVMKNEMVISNK